MKDLIEQIEESNLDVKIQNELKEIVAAFIIILDGKGYTNFQHMTGFDHNMCTKILNLHRRTMDNFKESLYL